MAPRLPGKRAVALAPAASRKGRSGKTADPLRLRSLAPEVINAFYGAYAALRSEIVSAQAAFEDHEARASLADPEDLLRRRKQLERAAEIVMGLQVALERGHEASLEMPFRWARSVTGPFIPAPPKAKLRPAKDWLLEKVTHAIVSYAPPAEYRSEVARVCTAARVLASHADAHRSRARAPSRVRTPLDDFAFHVAAALMDPEVYPVAMLLPPRTLAASARAIAEELATRGVTTFEDPVLVVAASLRALGLAAEEAHSFYGYLSKQQKRRASGGPK
jgi:hypothetical protein